MSFLIFLGGCSAPPSTPADPQLTPQYLKKQQEWATEFMSGHSPEKGNSLSKPEGKTFANVFKKKVTLSIGENLPIREVFLALSQQNGFQLQWEGAKGDKIIFTAANQPLHEVIKGVCSLSHLRCQFADTVLRVSPDVPYSKNYHLQFLNSTRTTENNTAIGTNVFSSDSSQTRRDNGSNSSLMAKSENKFWEEVEANLKVILADSPASGETAFTVHRQGGIITVRARDEKHKVVEDYVRRLKQSIGDQVLIEAKIIEVNLKDEFKAGINWALLAQQGFQAEMFFGNIARSARMTDPLQHQQDILTLGAKTGDFKAIITAIQQFGACKTLSSPRLTVLNNQSAILKVAQNQVYFRLRYDRENNLRVEKENIIITSDIQTVPIGLVLSVQPSINQETGKITLALRPTVSRLTRSVADPAVDLIRSLNKGEGADLPPSLIPIVEVREIDSILEVDSGRIAILGGLMETRKAHQDSKLPFVGDIPGVGKLFTGSSHVEEIVELVILLKATRVSGAQYEEFVIDAGG